jgi:hypothetical protein
MDEESVYGAFFVPCGRQVPGPCHHSHAPALPAIILLVKKGFIDENNAI